MTPTDTNSAQAPGEGNTETNPTNQKKGTLYWIVAHTTGLMYLILAGVMFWVYFEHIAGKPF